MADLDITTSFHVETPDSPAVARFADLLEASRKQIEYVKAAMASSGAPTKAYQARLDDLTQTEARLAAEVDRLRASESAHVRTMMEESAAAAQAAAAQKTLANEYATVAVKQGGVQKSSVQAGMAMLQMGYFVDDLQYGLRGVVNNIPNLIASLGLGAGLAGVVGIAAVAVSQLVSHWEQLAGAFGASTTQTEAERMEALAKATARTVDETATLAQYKREQAAGESLLTDLPKAKREEAQRVHEAMVEAGGPELVKAFARRQEVSAGDREALVQQAEAERRGRERARGILETFTSGEQWANQWQTIKRNLGIETKQQQVAGLARGIQIDYEQFARRDLARAETDPAWRGKMLAQIDADPAAFPAGAAAKIRAAGADPSAAKARAANDAKARSDALGAYKFAAADLIRLGVYDKDDADLRAFQAGQLPIAGLGAKALRIRAEALANTERAAAAEGDPEALRRMDTMIRLMKADRQQHIPPKPPVFVRP